MLLYILTVPNSVLENPLKYLFLTKFNLVLMCFNGF